MSGARAEVAVVGGGFSGLLTALHLLSAPDGPHVHLVEGGGRFGVGAAYAPHHAGRLLNVRAGNMSAFPDRPAHFVDWLRRRHHPADPAAFVSRAVYGDYLHGLLRAAATGEAVAGRLVLVRDTVAAARRRASAIELRLATGRTLTVQAVVLALGAGPPRWPRAFDGLPSALLVSDPWAEGATDGVDPSRPVLVLGSGLTMVDIACGLIDAGQAAPIVALSRRGLAPHAHSGSPAAEADFPLQGGLAAMLAQFRRQAQADDWRTTFDSLRPATGRLWNGLSPADRRRFLVHLRPYWDIHRHRLAPAIHARLEQWRVEGRLQVIAGRPVAAVPCDQGLRLRYRRRGEREVRDLGVGAVVNATGPDTDIGRSADPLLADLRGAGLIRPDPMRLGLDVTPRGEVLDRDGRADFRLTAIGPLTRGRFWEAGAVPDLRVHALELARHVAARLAAQASVDATG